jgi:hypothetical protein
LACSARWASVPSRDGSRRPAPRRGGLVEPGRDQTAIELPYRLILSPPSSAGFAHEAKRPALPGLDRAELWHSRLGLAPGTEGTPHDHAQRTVRAVWVRIVDRPPLGNPYYALNPPKPPVRRRRPSAIPCEHVGSIATRSRTSSNWKALETAPIEVSGRAERARRMADATGRWEVLPDGSTSSGQTAPRSAATTS